MISLQNGIFRDLRGVDTVRELIQTHYDAEKIVYYEYFPQNGWLRGTRQSPQVPSRELWSGEFPEVYLPYKLASSSPRKSPQVSPRRV